MGVVTNIKVKPMELSWGGSALGFTEGDLELTLTEDAVDVTAHQEGTNILSAIRTGKNVELSVSLKETNKALVDSILSQSGAVVTASGSSSAVVAWGGSKDFTHVLTESKKLVMHPVAKASGDLTEDVAAWLAYPMPESISFSGENPSLLNVTFKIFPDASKAKSARLLVFGNHLSGNFASVS
jgi:hypothetical protein